MFSLETRQFLDQQAAAGNLNPDLEGRDRWNLPQLVKHRGDPLGREKRTLRVKGIIPQSGRSYGRRI
jgi:hypothetical protein